MSVKLIKSILVCVSLFSFAFADSRYLQDHAYKDNEFCSPITGGLNMMFAQTKSVLEKNGIDGHCSIQDGLQFCADVTVLVDKENNRRVILKTSLKNVTDSSLTLDVLPNFYDRYSITIRDDLGDFLDTNEEIEREKAKTGADIIVSLPASSNLYDLIRKLAPKEEFNVEYDLGSYYLFDSDRTYSIEIGRKLKVSENNLTEIKVNPITIGFKKLSTK